MPHTKSLANYWRKMPQWYRLEGVACESCGEAFFPVRSICPNCRRGGELKPFTFSGKGKVYSYTKIYAPPEGFELEKPYALGIIDLEEGPKVTGQIVDCKDKELKIGDEVETVFRKIRDSKDGGIIQYGYKFRPLD